MWLKKYWPAVLAVAAQFPALWNFIKWLLDWRGRVDALAATYHEIGGWDAMIGYILDPPPWLYQIAFIASVLLIWLNVRRVQATAPEEKEPERPPFENHSVQKTRRKIAFIVCGLIVAGLTIFQGFRNSASQSELQVALKELKEKPLKVGSPGFMQLYGLFPVESDRSQPAFRAGATIRFNSFFINGGGAPVYGLNLLLTFGPHEQIPRPMRKFIRNL
jgi:hypothetical protein